MKIAIADIGSNTVKMTVFSESGEILFKKSSPVGLISYVKEGILIEDGVKKLAQTLTAYGKYALREGADTLFPFATASLRAARNAREVIERIREETGYTIDLVSGKEEAALSFEGIALSMGAPLTDGTLLDMGGGSCEIVSPNGSAVSLPIGSLALFLRSVSNLLPTGRELEAVYTHVHDLAAQNGIAKRGGEVYAVGGTLRAFCKLHAEIFGRCFSEDSAYTFTREEILKVLARVSAMTNETKMAILRLIPDRVHTFAPGITAIVALLDCLGKESVTVVAGGAREGYFARLKKKLTESGETAG